VRSQSVSRIPRHLFFAPLATPVFPPRSCRLKHIKLICSLSVSVTTGIVVGRHIGEGLAELLIALKTPVTGL
jgi:hypothetical protein